MLIRHQKFHAISLLRFSKRKIEIVREHCKKKFLANSLLLKEIYEIVQK